MASAGPSPSHALTASTRPRSPDSATLTSIVVVFTGVVGSRRSLVRSECVGDCGCGFEVGYKTGAEFIDDVVAMSVECLSGGGVFGCWPNMVGISVPHLG